MSRRKTTRIIPVVVLWPDGLHLISMPKALCVGTQKNAGYSLNRRPFPAADLGLLGFLIPKTSPKSDSDPGNAEIGKKTCLHPGTTTSKPRSPKVCTRGVSLKRSCSKTEPLRGREAGQRIGTDWTVDGDILKKLILCFLEWGS